MGDCNMYWHATATWAIAWRLVWPRQSVGYGTRESEHAGPLAIDARLQGSRLQGAGANIIRL